MLKPLIRARAYWRRLPRWARIAFASVAGTLLLAAVAWAALTVSARSAFRRDIAEIRAKGEAATVGDLVGPPVPEQENAASLLEIACFRLEDWMARRDRGGAQGRKWLPLLPLAASPETLRDEVRDLRTRTIELVREALQRPRCRSNSDYVAEPSGYRRDAGWACSFLVVARLLDAAALECAGSDRADEAVERVALALDLAEAVSDEPTASAQAVSCEAVVGSLRTLKTVCDTVPLPVDGRRALVARLGRLDVQRMLVREMIARRAFGLENVEHYFQGTFPCLWDTRPPPDISLAGVLPFVADWEKARALRLMTEAVDALKLPPGRCFSHMGSLETRMREPVSFRKLRAPLHGYEMCFCPFGRYYDRFDAWALRNVSIVGLACEIFRSARGRLPGALDQLAPEFLPDVPADPFTGRPLVYVTTGGRFRVFSLGKNLRSDGGRFSLHHSGEDDVHWVSARGKGE